ncbi:hypothetical protein C2845_PM08G14780 [Panicum miliaceum]|uniref:Uncharacterized protein n=1 Tax=Panicum miliaceum TaxID=4540 RepID=A0A3L6R0E3_PANMI|nr:hypothetical protein C2845_PM08G14780 [Panicum miliaceum]
MFAVGFLGCGWSPASTADVHVPSTSGKTIQASFPPRTSRRPASSPFLVEERGSRNKERHVVPRSVTKIFEGSRASR